MSEFTFRCPKCDADQNRSKKLYINVDKGVFNCFRCNYHGPIAKLNHDYPELVSGLEDSAILSQHLKIKQFNPFQLSELSKNILAPLGAVHQIVSGDMYYEYLQSRGWSEYMIGIYGPLYSEKPSYEPYVILPVYDNDEMLYFVGRDVTEEAPVKYKNSPVPKTDVIFDNLLSESVLYPEDLFICEGIFDSAKLPSSIALLGKSLNKCQENAMFSRLAGKKSVYICLDDDAKLDVSTLYNKLTMWHPEISYYQLKYPISKDGKKQDLGDLSVINSPIQLVKWVRDNSERILPNNPMQNLRERFSLVGRN